MIPQRCVTELQGIFSVYIVDENNKVQNRRVEVGDKIEGFWLIKSGLKPGENIIFEGLQFVKEGVNVNSTIEDVPLPTFEMN